MLPVLFARVALLIGVHAHPFLLLFWEDTRHCVVGSTQKSRLVPRLKLPVPVPRCPKPQPNPHLPPSVPRRPEQPKQARTVTARLGDGDRDTVQVHPEEEWSCRTLEPPGGGGFRAIRLGEPERDGSRVSQALENLVKYRVWCRRPQASMSTNLLYN